MSFDLPSDAVDWQARVRAFVDKELIPWEVEAELNGGEIPAEARERHCAIAQDLGLPAMDVPQDRGGLGLSTVTQVAVYEELGRVTNALSWCFSEAHRWMFEACSEDQIARYVRPIMMGERHECYAITESESGSDVDGIAATARRDGQDYVLNGEKWYVTSANLADFCVFQAKTAPESEGESEGDRHETENGGAHALFFVDLDRPGIEMVASPLFSHTYPHHHPTYRFTDVRVPAANRIGKEGDGMDFSYAWFRRERLMIAARCCGAAARLIDEATAFAKERRVSDAPIAHYQAIQFMLADSVTELWAARLMTYECAAAHDRGDDVKLLHARCSMAKLYASEMANRVADRAVQIFGGRGYMRENVAERFFRELRVDRIWEGTSEIQRLIVANDLLKRGLPELGVES